MCDVCLKNPCHPRCPNASDPAPVTTCRRCKEGILAGDEYAVINGDDYCLTCIEDMPYSELVTLMGGEWKTAEEEN